ncbi:hypothetical protein OIU77_031041 [Salix suchowensis]|uniref:GST N-terminal domain-containing protein n=1 Tax=Salix suchowensis TaxID=1278906 RepID=A0ABQ9BH44_9ROSI|nr:hypothetical protein OIU77_031041 [Salix suchowensis]
MHTSHSHFAKIPPPLFLFTKTLQRKSWLACLTSTNFLFSRSVHGSPKTPRKSFPIIRATSETPTSSTSTSVTAPPNFEPPKPKRFAVRPDKTWDIIGASLALIFRLGTGVFVNGYSVSFVSKDAIPPDQYSLEVSGYKVKETSKLGPRPEKPIEIYEFEGSEKLLQCWTLMFCFILAHKNGPTFRPKVVQMGGKQQFPYMVDPNTGTAMYESDDIIKYLVQKYGDGSIPFMLSLGLLTTLTEGFAMIGRMGKGSSYTPSKLPPKPVELWAYEGSPFCKIVREVLVELELPHIFRSCARGSPKRQILFEKTGHFQAPYIEDPNTGVQMFESAEIVEYLKATYASS